MGFKVQVVDLNPGRSCENELCSRTGTFFAGGKSLSQHDVDSRDCIKLALLTFLYSYNL